MNALSARIGFSLMVAALVGLIILDLLYIFDGQRTLARQRQHELAWVATRVAAELPALAQVEPYVARMGAEHGIVITLVGDDGRLVQSHSAPQLAKYVFASAPLVAEGYESLAMRTTAKPWLHVIASRPLKETIDMVLARQPRVLALVALTAGLITLIALGFMRRSVLQPIEQSFADRRRIEQQLADLTVAHRQLEETRDRLVRAERLAAVGRLAAGLAHEIGNPLAVLTGYTSALRDPSLPQPQRDDALQRMERELARIQGTVRDLLDYARAPSGVAGTALVVDVAEHVRKLVQPQAGKKNVTVATKVGTEQVAMSTDSLTQVLLNLTLNALDAVPADARIVIAASVEDKATLITVDDSGPGIAPEHGPKVFEPFFTTKAAGIGTGLGLSVCESLVTAANGSITADKSPTLGGARFSVRLPTP
ncbi:MAG: sensor histidine kinase [Myxococcota bacterium]